MFTPQQIQEVTFPKSRFGGYNVEAVDDFLCPLTEDYVQLYKENSVLKSKMRILVQKLEEYRAKEASLNDSVAAAQKTCEQMIADARRRSEKIVKSADTQAAVKTENVDAAVSAENDRLARAKAATADYIATVEAEIRRQLEALNNLKLVDATAAEKPSDEDIADMIQENVDKLVLQNGQKPEPAASMGDTKQMPAIRPDRFNNLQFGKNYTPQD